MSLFSSPSKAAPKSTVSQKENQYSAKDIEVLEGLEPVRKRPGMYIGGTDERALHHLIAEVLDNAMDEVVAGHAKTVTVHLSDDGSLCIEDNGRGIPIDPHPKFPTQSALEVILTTLHSGGKFTAGAYDTAGGLHGVGISVVNALSKELCVQVARGGRLYQQKYSRGKAITALEDIGPTRKKGTKVTFTPDDEIFGDLQLKPALAYQMIQSKAYLQKGVEILWSYTTTQENPKTPISARFFYPDGLFDYLKDIFQSKELPLEPTQCFHARSLLADQAGTLEWAIAFADGIAVFEDDEPTILSYCNTIPTPLGGTHESAFKQGLLKAVRAFIERTNSKKAAQVTADDIGASFIGVVSAFISQPQFQGQTKEKLASAHISRPIENLIKDHLDHWLSAHPQSAQQVVELVLQKSDERLKRRQNKEVARQSATKRLRLPGKLSDCSSNDSALCELFLVEGDSAGGSAKQARLRATQAVLPLRGKILNVASATGEKMRQNQEIQNLMLALGCGTGSQCDPSKLRYNKVIIMTDADVDGAHIASLIMTFFYQEMYPIVRDGHVYLARPPLYRLRYQNKIMYAQDDAHKDQLLKKLPAKAKVEIARFKGLGEMPVDQLKSTTMDPTQRILLKVQIGTPENRDKAVYDDIVGRLMGKNPEARFHFIQENAPFMKELDV